MKFTLRALTLVIFLFFLNSLYALPIWSDDSSIQVEISELQFNLDSDERELLKRHFDSLVEIAGIAQREIGSPQEVLAIRNLVEGGEQDEASEEVLEGFSKSRIQRSKDAYLKAIGFFKEWKDNFNFKNLFYKAYRYHWTDSKADIRESLRDLLTLWAFSHSIEMSYGIVASTIAALSGASLITAGTHLGIGAIISTPLLDPLCWILVGTFALSFVPTLDPYLKYYRRGIGFLRMQATYIGKKISKKLELQKKYEQFFKNERALDYLARKLAENTETRTTSDYTDSSLFVEFKISDPERSGRSLRWITRQNPDGSSSVVELEITNPELFTTSDLQTILRKTHSTFQFTVLEIFKNKENTTKLEGKFFIESVVLESNSLRVQFTPGSIYLRKKSVRRTELTTFACSQIF